MRYPEKQPESPEATLLRDDLSALFYGSSAYEVGFAQDWKNLEAPMLLVRGGYLTQSQATHKIRIYNLMSLDEDEKMTYKNPDRLPKSEETFCIMIGNQGFQVDDSEIINQSGRVVDDQTIMHIRFWLRETSWSERYTADLAAGEINH